MIRSTLFGMNLDTFFFGKDYAKLEVGIKNCAKLQTVYAFNIANLATPRFKPKLPPEDLKMLRDLTISGRPDKEVLLEFLMGRMSENGKRYTAYLTLWKGNIDTYRRIVTLGK